MKRLSTTNRTSKKGVIVASAALVFALTFSSGVIAGPDCAKKPDHPSCGGDGGDGGGGGSVKMEAYTLNGGHCAGADVELEGDTRDASGCLNTMTGSHVPTNTRELFTDFQQCIVDMTVPGTGSEILLIKASFNSKRDKGTGEILTARLYFLDDNGVEYDSDDVWAQGTPDATGYTVEINATIPIYTRRGKNSTWVGDVCVDEVVYEPLP